MIRHSGGLHRVILLCPMELTVMAPWGTIDMRVGLGKFKGIPQMPQVLTGVTRS